MWSVPVLIVAAVTIAVAGCSDDTDDASVPEGFPSTWPVPGPPGTLECDVGEATEVEPGARWFAVVCLSDDDEAAQEAVLTYVDELADAGFDGVDRDEMLQLLQTGGTSDEHEVFVQVQVDSDRWGLRVTVEALAGS